MKKFLALLLVVLLVFSLGACKKPLEEETSKEGTEQNDPEQPGTPEKPSDEETPESGAVSEKFFNMFQGGKYRMKARMDVDGSGLAVLEVYVDGDLMATEMEMMGMQMRTVLSNNTSYTIMDDQKMVMIMEMPEEQETGAIETDGMEMTGSGTDEFCGKTLSYEEYANADGMKVQYFLDGSDLAGVRTVTEDGVIDVEILELDKNVPASVFEIPSDYEMLDMSSMMEF